MDGVGSSEETARRLVCRQPGPTRRVIAGKRELGRNAMWTGVTGTARGYSLTSRSTTCDLPNTRPAAPQRPPASLTHLQRPVGKPHVMASSSRQPAWVPSRTRSLPRSLRPSARASGRRRRGAAGGTGAQLDPGPASHSIRSRASCLDSLDVRSLRPGPNLVYRLRPLGMRLQPSRKVDDLPRSAGIV